MVTQNGTKTTNEVGVSTVTGMVTVPQQSNNNAGRNAVAQFGRRRICTMQSSLRYAASNNIASIQISTANTSNDSPNTIHGFLELDSHAETACIGPECRVRSVTEQVCKVNAYHPYYNAFEAYPVVPASSAFEDPEAGKS